MGDSFRYPQGCKLEQGNSRIFLPKVGWLRYRNSRPILGKVCNVTVSQSGGKTTIKLQPSGAVITSGPDGISFTGVQPDQVEFKWDTVTAK